MKKIIIGFQFREFQYLKWWIFSRDSDSRSTNVRSSIRSSVTKPQNSFKLSISYYHYLHHLSHHHSQHHRHLHTQHHTQQHHTTAPHNITHNSTTQHHTHYHPYNHASSQPKHILTLTPSHKYHHHIYNIYHTTMLLERLLSFFSLLFMIWPGRKITTSLKNPQGIELLYPIG